MPNLADAPTRGRPTDYAFSQTNSFPNLLTGGAIASTGTITTYWASNAIYREDLLSGVAPFLREVEVCLDRFAVRRTSLADLAFVEAPSDSNYQDAYEWKPVTVRVVEVSDTSTTYSGDGEVWR